MKTTQRLRIRPALVIVAVIWLVRFGLSAFASGTLFEIPIPVISVLAGVAGGAAILLWWLLFSRAAWSERLVVTSLLIFAGVVTYRLVHPSIAGAAMGMMLPIQATPVIATALVVWAAIARPLAGLRRAAALAAALLLACVPFTLLRTDGVTGDGQSQLQWRWTPTAEQRLLASAPPTTISPPPVPDTPAATSPAPTAGTPTGPAGAPVESAAAALQRDASATPPTQPDPSEASGTPDPAVRGEPEWPGFRGPMRDSIITGVRINTDWSASPPAELWRRAIGPGWSSFAVDGDRIFTQEQRGADELVTCYQLSTGEAVWVHRDSVRFYESNGGPGPRATPTVHQGRIFSHGATGIVNALDAATGKVIWSRNSAADTGVTLPEWGLASSPIVIDDRVVIAVSGELIAYDATTGERRWSGPEGGAGYSSPHLAVIDGVPQILLIRGSRTISVSPADGTLLWGHSSGQPSVGIVQPALLPDGNLLVSAGDAMGGLGVRRLAVSQDDGGWHVEERWVSRGLKPYFNDFVVHNGHAFGFDGNILSSIDIADGTRKWKGGRYGSGQLLLLADQDLLLVIAEEGDLALVSATPDKYTEIARHPALSSKTWNHPVMVGNVLLVRNGEEMVAFRLPMRPGT
jgi:outer membrane protein assembly factor BamB